MPAHAIDPPLAETRPQARSVLGVKWEDPYFWLREKEDPAVRAYLEAENAYLDSVMAPLQSLRATLVEEMKSRIIEEDASVPIRRGDWLYYSRELAGKEHPLICRKPWHSDRVSDLLADALPGEEQIVLDLNERAGESPAYSFGGGAVSPDGRLYAWKENHDGTDRYLLRIKEIESGKLLPDEIAGSVYAAAPVWSLDNRHLFYNEGDETDRSWRVRRHRLGAPSTEAAMVYEEADPRFSVEISPSKSARFLVITSRASDTNENSILPLDQPEGTPQLFLPRREGIRYELADSGEHWFLLSNEKAVNGSVFRTRLDRSQREHWEEILPGDPKIAYESIDGFAKRVVLDARRDGVPGFFLLDPVQLTTKWITSPTEGGWVATGSTPEYEASAQRFSYETLLKPYTVAEVDFETGEIRTLKEKASPPDFDPSKYRVERTLATASDGTKIPIWLLLPAGAARDGGTGLILDGYGAYGISNDPWFDTNIFSLLDRGVGYAVAQVRGGGEYGRPWYEAGKLANKTTTFTDYIACAEHLIAEGYSSKSRLCGTGASAGGLLAGAVLNQRPDLFAGFVLGVPFVDVLNTMLDPSLPLTTGEYDEWGDPASTREIFERIRDYAPYENLKAQAYPAVLALAGWNDNRVPYWEAAKWIAKLRRLNTGSVPPLLHTEFETGHGGASGRYSELDEVALQYVFFLKVLGLAPHPSETK